MSLALAGIYGVRPAFWPLPSKFLSGTAAAGGIALINSIGNLGGYVGPFIVGWIKNSTNSFEIAPYFLAACSLASGAVAFFAVPYTIVIYPILFLVFPRLWNVCHKHGYITAGDFVRGRFGNRWLALAISVTGIVATMPYIALQLVGIQVVLGALGISGTGLVADLPLIIAFIILAAFTYSSGLRAPASIAMRWT